jgi:hypothetical protein
MKGSLLLKTGNIQEKIAQRKIIFFKPAFDFKSIRKLAEKAKNQMFTKFFVFKTNPEESIINTIDKFFEPYIVIDGHYVIEYSMDWNHSIKVNEEMQKLKISNKNFEPKLFKKDNELPYKILELEGTGRFFHEERKRLVFDQQWKKVRLDILPYLPFEEEANEILNETDNKQLLQDLKAEKEVEILKSIIFKRPQQTKKIHHELFSVTERALVFKPMYKITATHTKTKKEITFQIDGVNGKIVSTKSEKRYLQMKNNLKEIGSKVYSISKNNTKKLYTFLKKAEKR